MSLPENVTSSLSAKELIIKLQHDFSELAQNISLLAEKENNLNHTLNSTTNIYEKVGFIHSHSSYTSSENPTTNIPSHSIEQNISVQEATTDGLGAVIQSIQQQIQNLKDTLDPLPEKVSDCQERCRDTCNIIVQFGDKMLKDASKNSNLAQTLDSIEKRLTVLESADKVVVGSKYKTTLDSPSREMRSSIAADALANAAKSHRRTSKITFSPPPPHIILPVSAAASATPSTSNLLSPDVDPFSPPASPPPSPPATPILSPFSTPVPQQETTSPAVIKEDKESTLGDDFEDGDDMFANLTNLDDMTWDQFKKGSTVESSPTPAKLSSSNVTDTTGPEHSPLPRRSPSGAIQRLLALAANVLPALSQGAHDDDDDSDEEYEEDSDFSDY